VNVVCVDFDSFILIFHLFSHGSMSIRCSCKSEETVMGILLLAKIAVSSADVPIIVLFVVGRSCV
jgi:hypothetical protein